MITVKVLHILAVISWMAGLLYLPRLFVYHRDSAIGGEAATLFIVMERRLLNAIMLPASIVTVLTGAYLAHKLNLFNETWFIVKLICVVLMSLSHYYFIIIQKRFAKGERPLTSRAFRLWNEVPTVLMIVIVVMVIARPF